MNIIFGAEHTAILSQFKKHEERPLSADDVQGLTNIEPVRVNVILSDLVEHDLLVETNTDEIRGHWQYTLSEKGQKYLLATT